MAHYVCVTGGRTFDDVEAVRVTFRVLHGLHGGDLRVIQGGARGADLLARQVADEMGVPCRTYAADWEGPCDPEFCKKGHRIRRDGGDYCPAAGARRNAQMAEYLVDWRSQGHSVALLAFRGESGTADMIERAEAHSIPVSHG